MAVASPRAGSGDAGAGAGDGRLLPPPFGELSVDLSPSDLQLTAYEVFAYACRTTGSRRLTYRPRSPAKTPGRSALQQLLSPSGPFMSPPRSSTDKPADHRPLTGLKKAFGLKKEERENGKFRLDDMGPEELMRVQMQVSEAMETSIRKVLGRIAPKQYRKRSDHVVLPLEFLQQLTVSDFPDLYEYDAWRRRNLKLLEAGLLVHPLIPLDMSDNSAERLRAILRDAANSSLETGKDSETMHSLRPAVLSVACRWYDGTQDECHWADGPPLNLYLYEKLLEACFDSDDFSAHYQMDELLVLIKKTWAMLGINQTLHSLCYSWVLFNHFIASGQIYTELLSRAASELAEVAKDAKKMKDSPYSKVLISTLNSMLVWTEKRLLTYHDTFDTNNIDNMEGILFLAVTSSKILIEDLSVENRRRRREISDVACSKVDTYIRSSVKAAFAHRMEDDNLKSPSRNSSPLLVLLAKDVRHLAIREQQVFCPILKRWHPFALGVAVATLHYYYGRELKEFIGSLTELTASSVQVLKVARKMEEELIRMAVEDSVESEDGGKSVVQEMLPYEVNSTLANHLKRWIKPKIDKLTEWVHRGSQQERWNLQDKKHRSAPSAVDMLRLLDELVEAYFQFPIPDHSSFISELAFGVETCLQIYVSNATSCCRPHDAFIPPMPALTRCDVGPKLWKKKEKAPSIEQKKSHAGSTSDDSSLDLQQICAQLNTLQYLRGELTELQEKINKCLEAESAQAGAPDALESARKVCKDGIDRLCQTTAYKVIFQDMSHVLWDGLYSGDLDSSRIGTFLAELHPVLEKINSSLLGKVRIFALAAIMKAAFDGFLMVLLAGGPSRAFTCQDSEKIEEDFNLLEDFFIAGGDGVPPDLAGKEAQQVMDILPLFREASDSLIERYKQLVPEAQIPVTRTLVPPPTTGRWNPSDPNTVLRVLCRRKDDTASKFLKKTYNLPKKLQHFRLVQPQEDRAEDQG